HRRRGAILGPKGSGKTTLVLEAAAILTSRGRSVEYVQLRQGERRWNRQQLAKLRRALSLDAIAICDGFEQLSLFDQWLLSASARRAQSGLLVTAHERCLLPALYVATSSLELTLALVEELLPGWATVRRELLVKLYDDCGGNQREILRKLYDFCDDTTSVSAVLDAAEEGWHQE
ncbi:MAG: AAA family ATPase, partial [Bdellovibrionales bacterium]|nr:AAA family ATPase [Bdellovibrionales bacterium]